MYVSSPKTIITSITEDDESFQGKAYYSLAIIYLALSICNWASPSVINIIGPKFSMIVGGITYLLFIASFAIPQTWLLYLVSAIIGGRCRYDMDRPRKLSHPKFDSRNDIQKFWYILGDASVQERIDKTTRQIVIWTLSAVSLCGIVTLFFLRTAQSKSKQSDASYGPLEALLRAGKLFTTKNMLLLSVTFFYTGLELGFFSGVYSSCIGFTESFSNRKELVGISGIFIGFGEVLGGAVFGLLGSRTSKWGRDPIVTGGFIIHATSFFLIFLNLPNNSPFSDTSSSAIITSSGACDAVLFPSWIWRRIYSLLGSVYSDQSASAFAIFKFTQSVGAALCFVYAESLVLYGQLGILLIFAILGTLSFVMVEWSIRKEVK
ncbi:hypothetical protein NQ318_000134 [Aromia moschata]|uniref:UNC93-like protein MFSD11 n=1 Tax=Aromia moschata TaxID=1265417 RepID=A0AAV8XIB0_9CUCU|nr:hypothetical protein NQ318_000134 [Aromia moschata]